MKQVMGINNAPGPLNAVFMISPSSNAYKDTHTCYVLPSSGSKLL